MGITENCHSYLITGCTSKFFNHIYREIVFNRICDFKCSILYI